MTKLITIIRKTLYGNRLRSTPRGREKVLALCKVDHIRMQRHKVKYMHSQDFKQCHLA